MHRLFKEWDRKPPRGTRLIPDHYLNKGLVAFWPFWEQAGTTAYDISGYKNHGQFTNMANPGDGASGWHMGQNSPGVRFNDVVANQYITAGNSPSLKLLGEMSCYCSFMFTATTTQYIIAHNRNATRTSAFSLRNSGTGAIEWGWYIVPNVCSSPTTISTKVWYKAVGVRTGRTGSWTGILYADWSKKPDYIDVTSTSTTDPTMDNETTDATSIGARASTLTQGSFMGGIVDDIRLWNRALTTAEVRELFENPYTVFEVPSYRKYFFQGEVAVATGHGRLLSDERSHLII
jgi:hypothetical protein